VKQLHQYHVGLLIQSYLKIIIVLGLLLSILMRVLEEGNALGQINALVNKIILELNVNKHIVQGSDQTIQEFVLDLEIALTLTFVFVIHNLHQIIQETKIVTETLWFLDLVIMG
jgi:hypothetical protein